MYAVIETGGKQFRVAPGQQIRIQTIPGEVGTAVTFGANELGRVLSVSDAAGALKIGADAASAKVSAKITAQDRGDKVIVFKFKRKKQYKRTIGHRQNYTAVTVESIQA